MKKLNAILTLFIVAVLMVLFCFRAVFIKIDIGQAGVRTLQYGVLGDKGLEPRDFGPGWHRDLPIIDNWNLFDSTVQTLEFATAQARAQTLKLQRFYQQSDLSRKGSPYGTERVELKSKEGFNVLLDVTVKFRIRKGQTHKLYKDTGREPAYKKFVANEVSDTLRTLFGRLSTEEFYNPILRREITTEAEAMLAKKLEARYVELIGILIRGIEFDKGYEQKILDKKLADQEVELNRSKTMAEEVRGETNKILQGTEARVHVINQELIAEQIGLEATTNKKIARIEADAKLEVAKLSAGANLYAAEKIAKAYLLEKEAEAKGEKLRAQALKGSGGANLVALEAVSNLKLREMTVSTLTTDFLDMQEFVSRLGATK